MEPFEEKLIKHIEEMIQVFDMQYENGECYVFFSEDEYSGSFCQKTGSLLNSFITLDSEEIKESAKEVALFSIKNDIPYLIIINIIKSFKHRVMRKLLQDPSTKMAQTFYVLTDAAENCIAQSYLNFEIDTFIKFNAIRMASIKRLNDINTLYLYEAHLLWFVDLVISLKNMDTTKMPELHPKKCVVGQWITTEAANIITDKVILDRFISLHKNLHQIAKQIELSFNTKPINFNILMLLLKKAEELSLSLGVELSIINNVRFQLTASRDPLTGALNRQLLFQIFSTQFELSRAIEKSFCIVMMDLDNFKSINDDFGHVEGDNVLKSFSMMIINNLRESDFFIRYGGEEFLLVLPSTSLDNAILLAEKLKESTHTLHESDNLQRTLSASFGVIEIIPGAQEVIDEILMSTYIQEADKELYFAKMHGKDRVISARDH